jgi:hypothetical protein
LKSKTALGTITQVLSSSLGHLVLQGGGGQLEQACFSDIDFTDECEVNPSQVAADSKDRKRITPNLPPKRRRRGERCHSKTRTTASHIQTKELLIVLLPRKHCTELTKQTWPNLPKLSTKNLLNVQQSQRSLRKRTMKALQNKPIHRQLNGMEMQLAMDPRSLHARNPKTWLVTKTLFWWGNTP